MKKLMLFMLLALAVSVSQAQNRGNIKGTVSDVTAGSNLEFATVAIVEPRDSSLISYTLTTKDGAFSLRNLPAEQPLKVIISFVGYQNFRKIINLERGQTLDLGQIQLSQQTQLSEVVVTGERQPIVFKKDTIEFNVEAFKTRPNAVVEDLLKKLPGLQVDFDGTITVNGRKVSKITVNGKDFFASDITVASRNINVDLIDKIQVIDDREDDPDRLKDDSQVEKIINLKLKKAIKKSVFGKVYAGQGTNRRYETGGMLNMFRDTLQLSLIGFGNNVNRAAFSNSELNTMGGLNRSGTSTYEAGIDAGGRTGGIQQLNSGGFNLNYDIRKKLKLNLMYFNNNSINTNSSKDNKLQFLNGATLYAAGQMWQKNKQIRHNINSVAQWHIDTASHIRFQPKLSYNEGITEYTSGGAAWNNSGDMVNQTDRSNNGNSTNLQYEHNLSYYRRFRKKGRSVNITNSLRLNPGNSTSLNDADVIKYLPEYSFENLYQETSTEEARNSGHLDINYLHQINRKISGELMVSSQFENNIRKVDVYDINPETKAIVRFVENQSADLRRDQHTYRVRPGIMWNISDNKRLRASANLQKQDVFNTFTSIDKTINRSYYNVFPSLSYSSGTFSVNYDMSMRQPEISQLQPAEVIYGIYRSSGNPDLKPVNRHSFYLSYRKSLPEPQIDFNVHSSIDLQSSAIVYVQKIDTSNGGTFSQPFNLDGTYYSWNSFFVSKRFKKIHDWQLRIFSSVSLNSSKSVFSLNGLKGDQYQYGTGLNSGLSLNWKDLVYLEPSYYINNNLNRFSVSTRKNTSFYRHNINNQIRVSWPKKVNLEISHQYSYNSMMTGGLPKTTSLLNASLSLQMLKKNNGQLKLTGFDLLNQNRGLYSYVYDNEQATGNRLVLQRYFMLTYQYNFNKTVTR